jgi:hypothetical protein
VLGDILRRWRGVVQQIFSGDFTGEQMQLPFAAQMLRFAPKKPTARVPLFFKEILFFDCPALLV